MPFEVHDLQQCFRSGPRIVAAANKLIAVNGDTMAKPMVSARGGEDEVGVFHGRSADIAQLLRNYHECSDVKWSDFAVLARTHRVLKRLQQVFDEANIPCQRIGGGWDITGTDEFRTLLAAMRLAANDGDNLSFLRLKDQFGLTSATYAETRKIAAERGQSHFHAHRRSNRATSNGLDDCISLGARGLAVPQFVQSMLVWMPMPVAVVQFWLKNCTEMTLPEALDWFATYDLDRENETEPRDAVTLCTAHAAKGLEWPYVFVVELNEGNFPSSQSVRAGDVSEERRLCYVAATRAQRGLYLHFRDAADQGEGRAIAQPSRFLEECGVMQGVQSGNRADQNVRRVRDEEGEAVRAGAVPRGRRGADGREKRRRRSTSGPVRRPLGPRRQAGHSSDAEGNDASEGKEGSREQC